MKSTLNLMVAFMFGILVMISCEMMSPEAPETELDVPRTLSKETVNMTFTGQEDHRITSDKAGRMMAAFQEDNTDGPYAWYFGADAIQTLLAQNGAVGLRIYGSVNEDGMFSPVLFGVAADGSDIGGGSGLSKAMLDSVVIMEEALPCPPFCGFP